MKKIMWLAGLATLLGSLAYTVISLNRWEWNRALFFGIVLLVAEVGLATGLVLRKLDSLRGASGGTSEDHGVLDALAATRPQHERFAWMRESVHQSNVFITMLVGGGVVLSGLAWVVDKVASKTITPARERALAGELEALAYPPDGLHADRVAVLANMVPHYDDPKLRAFLRRRSQP